ncbi:chemotaxis protein CheB [Paracoccus sp. (in: a-proteobacteria)]|uniref:chemotaxis protein CheB n=1 Tax=Paracoccus sp. TaxID=267 RepID=UPI00396CE143
MNQNNVHPRRAVAIGGSTGAVPVLSKILAQLPADFPAAVLAVIHVGSEGRNLLSQMFARDCPLPVMTAEDGDEVRPGHVYVAPADHHLLVMEGRIRLGRGPRENLSRPALDPLFRSVALEYGPAAVGIVLTGKLNDGAAGLEAIQRCGGVTIVQNPADSIAPDMPLGALDASDIGYRAAADDMAMLLDSLMDMPIGPVAAAPEDIRLEVDIALGRPCNSRTLEKIAIPATLTCPACGGVLSEVKHPPLRFRCQVGHAYTAQSLQAEQDNAVDEAVRVALRIVEERATLTERMAQDARKAGRTRSEESFRERAGELRHHAETLRNAAIGAMRRSQ